MGRLVITYSCDLRADAVKSIAVNAGAKKRCLVFDLDLREVLD